jgi:hypothetical protein
MSLQTPFNEVLAQQMRASYEASLLERIRTLEGEIKLLTIERDALKTRLLEMREVLQVFKGGRRCGYCGGEYSHNDDCPVLAGLRLME